MISFRTSFDTTEMWSTIEMYRIPRAVHFMSLATEHAKRSTCFRLSVGCLVADGKKIVALSHNGPPRGEPHCTGRTCPGPKGHCIRATHAEENALKELTSPSTPLDMFVTHSPCPSCALMITAPVSMIGRLFYQTEYRDASPLDMLVAKNIEVYRVTPSGYVTSFPSGDLIYPESLYT